MRACLTMGALLPLILAGCDDEDGRSPPANRAVATTPISSAQIGVVQAANAIAVVDPAPRSSPRGPALKSGSASGPPARIDYRAIGTEPFWAVTLRGSTAVLERPDRLPLDVAVTRSDDANAIRYRGEGFAMTVSAGPCSDGMSDAIWSDSVQIAFGEGTLKGCGGVREEP
ncbi:membrane-like protein [Sphingobium sp. AN558]|uniref:COG3650 family protein n=1 Tax=Sphingobium sp. AN558 TaxID=3133442 RepID=UPI0030C43C6E